MAKRRIGVPTFDANRQTISITPDFMDFLVREVVDHDLSRYQSKYGIIEFLPMRKDRTFRLNRLWGAPLLWQADETCEVTPMGGIRTSYTELSPTKLRAFMKFCPKEVYDSVFRAMISWNASGGQDMDEYLAVISAMLKEDAVMLTQGLLAVAFLGQLFDYSSIGFNANASAQEQVDFASQANIFKGILKKVQDATIDTMYNPSVLPDTINEGFSGINISTVARELLQFGNKKLQKLVYKGQARANDGSTVRPVLLCSSNLIPDIWDKAKDVADAASQNQSILREITVEQEGGLLEYYWRGIPIVPIDEFCIYDDYLNSDFYFAALTSTRNLQIGTNYSAFDDVENKEIGMTVQRVPSNQIKDGDAGAYYRDTHALLACDIANPELFSCTFKTY